MKVINDLKQEDITIRLSKECKAKVEYKDINSSANKYRDISKIAGIHLHQVKLMTSNALAPKTIISINRLALLHQII